MLLKGFASTASIVAHIIQPLLEARGCIQLFRLFAVAVVIWYERLAFDLASLECRFPTTSSTTGNAAAILPKASSPASLPLPSSSSSPASTAFRVTILSDPQLIDSHTYAWINQLIQPLRNSLQYLLRWASDTYAQKSYNAVVRTSGVSKSDGVIWLGDLLDGGRRPFLSNDDVYYFEKQAKRFKGLFEEKLPSIYLPGNHDIRIPLTHNPIFEKEWKDSKSRWLEEWGIWKDIEKNRSTWSRKGGKEKLILYPQGGPEEVNVESNQWNKVINAKFPLYLNVDSFTPSHEIVMIDSLELAGMLPAAIASDLNFNWQEEAKRRFRETYDFVESFQTKHDNTQRILISHIPLSRPANSNCNLQEAHHGVTRESHGVIDQGVDQYATYQNLLSAPVTAWILDAIQPELIFSGDNHDHCEVKHTYGASQSATELTLKAFSMTEGVRLPGYARLSLYYDSSNHQSTSSYVPCLLPDQISIWSGSYPLFLTIIFICLIVDRKWRLGASLDQWARNWVIRWQDWTGVHEDDEEEDWQMIEEGAGLRRSGDGGNYQSSGEEDNNDEDEDVTKTNLINPQSPGGTKRIRFGRSSLALQPISSRGLRSTGAGPASASIRGIGITPNLSTPTPSSSSFQVRAWRELRRAAKANERVQLRDGPLREMAKIFIWPLVIWVWLQLF